MSLARYDTAGTYKKTSTLCQACGSYHTSCDHGACAFTCSNIIILQYHTTVIAKQPTMQVYASIVQTPGAFDV